MLEEAAARTGGALIIGAMGEAPGSVTPEGARGWGSPTPVACFRINVYVCCCREQGWAFDSLLAAMWLQMMWLMVGETRRCDWCHRIIALEEGARSDKRFCSDKGTKNSSKCRQKWNYHNGSGKSSKNAKKRAREEKRS